MSILILLSVLGIISLFAGLTKYRKKIYSIVLLGLIGIFVVNMLNWNAGSSYFNNMMQLDNYAVLFIGLILLISFLVLVLSKNQFNYDEVNTGDYYGIILFTLAGAVMMVSFSNLVMLFIGIETLSISLYVLAGSRKNNLKSNEAALKYFIMGAFSTGFLLFGMVMIYGVTGSFQLNEIGLFVNQNFQQLSFLFYGGLLLMMTGLLFKVSAVPFHFWAPDVYEGSPNIITVLMATAVKIAAFAAFFRLFTTFSPVAGQWSLLLSGIAILTLIVGNFSALYQSNLKRLLAYSSVAHAGYLLLTIITLKEKSDSALLYYTLSYALASVGAFVVLILLAGEEKLVEIKNLNGLGKRSPVTAFLFTIVLLSLAGIPPTSGFFAKYYIFSTALENGHTWLVLIAIITALIGIYYYFRIITAMYVNESNEEPIEMRVEQKLILSVCAALSLVIGIFPDIIINLL